jgi:hypoxanthine phosphoribosyltransferase
MALKVDNKIFLSWDDINSLVENLCKKITESKIDITSITGIERGGLIPAVMISHKLNIPYSYKITPTTLVVDDICDTGVTLKNTVAGYTAVLHYKPHTACFIPTLYSGVHEGDEWIIYPWEKKDSAPVQDYLKR